MANRGSKSRTAEAAFLGVLLAAALLLGYVESLIPYDFAVPGIKLGLPNVVTLIILRKKGLKAALPFGIVRALLSNLLFGSALSLAYALSGCVVSVAAMTAAGKVKNLGIAGQSVIGGLGHNIGQITAAIVILRTPGIAYYTPFLMISGAVTGFATGVCAALLMDRVGRFIDC